MGDRKIAKNRFHRGMSAHLRKTMRKAGVALDEEAAQFALGGVRTFVGYPKEMLVDVINEVFAQRFELQRIWEAQNPKKNPYAPSFPERVIKLVNEALTETYKEDGTATIILSKLKEMCEAELSTDAATIEPDTKSID